MTDTSAASGALASIGGPAVEGLIDAIRSQGDEVKVEAFEALGGMGEAALEPLVDALTEKEWSTRVGAALALGKIGSSRGVEPLMSAARDENWQVREAAAKALGESADTRGVRALVPLLHDAYRVDMGGPGKGDYFDEHWEDWKYPVREVAAEALSEIGGPEAEQALAEHREAD